MPLPIELDGFKDVNDAHGHYVGDALLQGVASRWRETLGASDTLARLGGNKFAVLLGDGDHEAARSCGGTLRDMLRGSFAITTFLFV